MFQYPGSHKVTTTPTPPVDFRGESRAPEFIRPLRDLEIYAGATARFAVKLKGYPRPAVLWFRDGRRLPASARGAGPDDDWAGPGDDDGAGPRHGVVSVGASGNRDYAMSITNATHHDDAEYMCVARNVAGVTDTCCQLIVNGWRRGGGSRGPRLEYGGGG